MAVLSTGARGSSRARKHTPGGTPSKDADAGLMTALLQGDHMAAEALYGRFAKRIRGLGLALLGNTIDAEDLVQDTFLKIWRAGSAFDPRRGSLEGWILMNARSLAIDALRRRTSEARALRSQPSHLDVSDDPSPEWYAEHHDLMRRVRKAMDRLSPGQRSALELAYLGQHSSGHVAELQGIPRGTVKSRIRAGIASLRATIVDSGQAA